MRRAIGIAVVGLGAVSCRSLLDTDVRYDDGAGAAAPSGSTSAESTSASSSASSAGAGTSSGGGAGGSGSVGSSSSAGGAGGSGSSSTSSGGGSGGSGGGASCPASDDFDGGIMGPCWDDRAIFAGGASTMVQEGRLAILPNPETGWWDDVDGEHLAYTEHQRVAGPFAARVWLQIEAEDGVYQMAGMLLRSPTSEAVAQSWIKWEIGRRGADAMGNAAADRIFGSLAGANRPGSPAAWILEAREHARHDVQEGWLGVCRDGDQVHLAFGAPRTRPAFVVEHSVFANGSEPFPDLPDEIQLGLMANAFDKTAALTASFDDFAIALGPVGDGDGCRAALEALEP